MGLTKQWITPASGSEQVILGGISTQVDHGTWEDVLSPGEAI